MKKMRHVQISAFVIITCCIGYAQSMYNKQAQKVDLTLSQLCALNRLVNVKTPLETAEAGKQKTERQAIETLSSMLPIRDFKFKVPAVPAKALNKNVAKGSDNPKKD